MNLGEFIYSKKRKQRVIRHVLFWLLCYVYMVLSFPPKGGGSVNGIGGMGFSRYYEMILIRTWFHIFCQWLFCYLLMYLLIPFFFWKKKYLQFMGLLLILWFVVAIFRFIIFSYGYNPLMYQLKFDLDPSPLILARSFTQTLGGPAFVSFVFISFKFFKDLQVKQRDNFNLQRENASAELRLLKAQVHPHFLFNTLNNIYSFTLDKLPYAKDMVKKLDDMLHYMIEECDQPQVPVKNEIKILRDYFELERIRYGNSLDIQFEIVGDADDKVMAPLLMIPFVENSFKHGTSKMLRAPWIKLFLQVDEDMIHFSLTNSKPAMETSNLKKGIGLSNVKKRLKLLYPEKHYLLIESTTNTFTVNMQIPLEHKDTRTEPINA